MKLSSFLQKCKLCQEKQQWKPNQQKTKKATKNKQKNPHQTWTGLLQIQWQDFITFQDQEGHLIFCLFLNKWWRLKDFED